MAATCSRRNPVMAVASSACSRAWNDAILGIKVQALEQGIARCEVTLNHDDASKPEDALKDMAAFKITVPRR